MPWFSKYRKPYDRLVSVDILTLRSILEYSILNNSYYILRSTVECGTSDKSKLMMSALSNSCCALVVIRDKDNRARNRIFITFRIPTIVRIESWTHRWLGESVTWWTSRVCVALIKTYCHKLRQYTLQLIRAHGLWPDPLFQNCVEYKKRYIYNR